MKNKPDHAHSADIGLVPTGWETHPLAELIEKPDYGFTASASSEPIGPKFLRITDIQDGKVQWDTVPYCSTQLPAMDEKVLRPNDIVIARIGATTGKAFLIDECPPAIFASYLIRIRTLEAKLSARFLYCLLQTDAYWQHIDKHKDDRLKGGVNIPILTGFQIPVPPLSEQHSIAEILDRVRAAISIETRVESTAQSLRHATLRELFTRGLRGEVRKETEVGLIPESWEVVRVGDQASVISKGASPKWQGFDYVDEGVLFVRSQNVGDGVMLLNDKVFLPASWNEKEKRSILRSGDLLVNLVGASIGRSAVGGDEIEGANCNQAVCFVRLNQNQVHPKFLNGFLFTPEGQRQIHGSKKDIARANLSLEDVRQFQIPKPSSEEQHDIVAMLDTIDQKIELHRRKRLVLESLFKSLLRKLVAGDVRVADLDLSTFYNSAATERAA